MTQLNDTLLLIQRQVVLICVITLCQLKKIIIYQFVEDNHQQTLQLPGAAYNGGIDDVKYLRDKLFAALKITTILLDYGRRKFSEDKTTLLKKIFVLQELYKDFNV